jgi:virginiamycin B lyase
VANELDVRRPIMIGIVAVVAAVAAIVFLFGNQTDDYPQPEITEFAIEGTPRAVAVGSRDIWVAGGDLTVRRIDPDSGREIASTNVPFFTGDVVVMRGSVWVGAAEGRDIRRLDENSVAPEDGAITIGRTPQSLAVGDKELWVTAFDDGVVRSVDPVTGTVEDAVIGSKDDFPADIAFGFGSLWIADVAADLVRRIEPETGELITEIEVGSGPTELVVGEGSVWSANYNDRTISQIDPATDQAGKPIVIGGRPGDIAAGNGFVWITRPGDDSVVRIDPKTGAWTGEVFEVGDQPQGVAVGLGAIWVANQGDGTLTRLVLPSMEGG